MAYHPRLGVCLGFCNSGLNWSVRKGLSQAHAVTFDSPEAAMEMLRHCIKSSAELAKIEIVAATADYAQGEGKYASMGSCMKAGLPGWLKPETTCLGEG